MVDLGTGLTILGAGVGGKDLIIKLLGPTADFLGEGMKHWTERGMKNLSRIFQNGIEKAGQKLEKIGSVPPKVLKGILSEGQYCEDPIAVEYFGGILASSKSDVSRDDRGATIIALLSRLSTYQLRTHYLFYYMVKELFDGQGLSIIGEDRFNACVFVPHLVWGEGIEFTEEEKKIGWDLLRHVMFGLEKERLIETDFFFGGIDDTRKQYPDASTAGIIFTPSVLGVELFLWAYGCGNLPVVSFLNPPNKFEIVKGVTISPGYKSFSRPLTDKLVLRLKPT